MLVLTGTGKSFSSGFNIGRLGEGAAEEEADAEADADEDAAFDRVTDRLERFVLPTICALNGGVYGGSTDLALACDFRIGVEGMAMFMPAARLGLHYYAGGLRRYVSRLGLNAAKRLFLQAQRVDTAELLRIGYLDEAVPRIAADGPRGGTGGDPGGQCADRRAGHEALPERHRPRRGRPGADRRQRGPQQGVRRPGGGPHAAWLEKRTPRFSGA